MKLESDNRQPMFTSIATTLEGLFSIRCYGVQERFVTYNKSLVSDYHKILYALICVKTFQAIYIDILICIFVFLTCIFCIVLKVDDVTKGLAVSNALQLLFFVQWTVRIAGEVHTTMSSVSSVVYFGNHVPSEAPSIIKESRPGKSWPSKGQVFLINLD